MSEGPASHVGRKRRLEVRLTADELGELERAAGERAMSVALYVRTRLFGLDGQRLAEHTHGRCSRCGKRL